MPVAHLASICPKEEAPTREEAPWEVRGEESERERGAARAERRGEGPEHMGQVRK